MWNSRVPQFSLTVSQRRALLTLNSCSFWGLYRTIFALWANELYLNYEQTWRQLPSFLLGQMLSRWNCSNIVQWGWPAPSSYKWYWQWAPSIRILFQTDSTSHAVVLWVQVSWTLQTVCFSRVLLSHVDKLQRRYLLNVTTRTNRTVSRWENEVAINNAI